MPTLAEAADEMVATLRAGGVAATTDERDLNPPGVLVGPPRIVPRFGRNWRAEWILAAVVANVGRAQANRALGDLVAAVQLALGYPVMTGRPVDLSAPDGAAPMPGYELTFHTIVPREDVTHRAEIRTR